MGLLISLCTAAIVLIPCLRQWGRDIKSTKQSCIKVQVVVCVFVEDTIYSFARLECDAMHLISTMNL